LKFFEKIEENNKVFYENPSAGFVIYKDITDPEIFEFYMQPQVVTEGTATPINYHVAYGNLKLENDIFDLTHRLCYCYQNWQGPVKVPAPLKLAEKACKMKADVTDKPISTNLSTTLYFL